MEETEQSPLAVAALRCLSDAQEPLLSTIAELASPETGPGLVAYLSSQISGLRQLTETLSHPEDEAELYRSLAFAWLELRFEWTRYNQVMQYQTVLHGEADEKVFLRGGVVSGLLAELEALLRPGDAETLRDLAAEPLRVIFPDSTEIQAFLSERASNAARLQAALSQASPGSAALAEVAAVGRQATTAPLSLVWGQIRAALPASLRLDATTTGAPVAVDVRWVEPLSSDLAALAADALATVPSPQPIAMQVSLDAGHVEVTFSPAPTSPLPSEAFTQTGAGAYRWQAPAPQRMAG